jgi:hypothetical protein
MLYCHRQHSLRSLCILTPQMLLLLQLRISPIVTNVVKIVTVVNVMTGAFCADCAMGMMLSSADTVCRVPTKIITELGSEWVTFWKNIW